MLRRESVIVAVLCLRCFVSASPRRRPIRSPIWASPPEVRLVMSTRTTGNRWLWMGAAGIRPPGGAVNLRRCSPGSWGATSCTVAGVNSSGQIDGTYNTASGRSWPRLRLHHRRDSEQINFPSESFITGVGNINENGYVALYYGSGIACSCCRVL